ncbi:MAG TPA: carboxypeptidase-like regulatory domain-containing protein [Candidatus Acidoferrum sp.]|nr:carboxypeptidase-like regulatory domain-containing protein [Candidatus Acidoferrum sp.]
MLSKRSLLGIGALLCLCALVPSALFAQSASTGTVAGTVTDPSGAAVGAATVTLTDKGTNIPRVASSNDNGRYIFVDVPAGTYDLTVSKQGFRISRLTGQTVNVGTALTLNVSLEVGSVAESVEVTASNAELQTLNATVGNTVSGVALDSLPSISRDASTFFTLQPGVAPDGSVAGVAMDQNSFQLDGGQNTNDMDGSMNIYTPSFAGDVTGGLISTQVTGNAGGGPTGVMPTPIDSVEEFKVSTTNQTADFNSSAGSQVSIVTKRGTSAWHGTGYEYYLDNNWSANSFQNNAAGIPVPSYHYSRFGVAGGGPLISKEVLGGKTYIFANYEGFRWPNSETISKAVPTASMRMGLLYFGGQYYNLNPNSVTFNGTTYAGTSLDPRGIGLNSLVSQMWSTMPLPNTTGCNGLSLCDNTPSGGNVGAFTTNMSVPQSSNFGVVRVDHDFGSKEHFMSSYRYYKLERTTDSQFNVAENGTATSLSARPQVPWFYVAALTTNITTNTTNDLHYSFLRNYWQWGSAGDPPQISGLGGALEPLGETTQALTPYNVNTQNTRTRFWDGKDNMIRDDVSNLHGNHLFQFGGTYQRNWDFHQRTDNGGGINYQTVYQLSTSVNSGINLTGIYPATLPSTSQTAFGQDYTAALGIVSIAQVAYTRSGPNLTLNPPLTPAEDKSVIPYYNVYFSDSWRVKPSITFTYGLSWTLEMPPVEQQGRQIELVDQAGQQIDVEAYLKQRENAALAGQVYNPELGFTLVGNTGSGQKYPYNPFYGEFSPRLALAWNPNYSQGLLGKMFGQGKTVVRGGYSRIYGRLNGVDLVLVPLLGTGLIQPVQCVDPQSPTTGSGACAGTLGSNPMNAFRVGTDGLSAPLPAPSLTLPQPDFPGYNAIAAATGEALDSNFRPDESDQFDLTVQRQINSKTMIEVGYIGRRITHEFQPLNINAVPYMMTLGGQTFAKAYATLETQYCGGGTTAGLAGGGCVGNVGAVTAQPFFENALKGTGYCTGYVNCTTAVAVKEGNAGTGNLGIQNVWSLWSDLDQGDATCSATQPCGFNFARTMLNSPIPGSSFGANGQLTSGVAVNASVGTGNYNAGFVTLKMANWHGLTLQQNFTFSKALGTVNVVQASSEFTSVDPYNVNAGYGVQPFDRKFVDNVLLVYQPPFFQNQHGVLGHLLGGWSFSPIFTAASGLPLELNTTNGDGQSFGEADAINFAADENAILTCANNFGSSRHNGVAPLTGPGSAGNVNMFANPAAVFGCVRDPILGLDGGAGGAGTLRGMPFWNVDFQVKKNIHINERFSAEFQSIFTNVFNHDQLLDPFLSLAFPTLWGVENTQGNTPRSIEVGVRFRF